ncbi:hypothetical protein BDZ94DRAFT_1311692 [Collybia nuda]|uniref:Uncharacterized protein n=1 Tax=Collybia nuda TaxID=64659 RepID=A0A9P5XYP6_9AGAR|nr:hypothetical protein BDZ94DRAFT_1311692 [Collybia nuda]
MAPFFVNPRWKRGWEVSQDFPHSASMTKYIYLPEADTAAYISTVTDLVTEIGAAQIFTVTDHVTETRITNPTGIKTQRVPSPTTLTYTPTYTTIIMLFTSAPVGSMGVAAKANTKVIVPSVISAAIAVLALSFLARCIIRRRRQQYQKDNSQDTNAYPFSGPDTLTTPALSISPLKSRNVERHNESPTITARPTYSDDPPPQYSWNIGMPMGVSEK